MHESMVSLSVIPGPPLEDLLYLSSQSNGGFDDAEGRGLKCSRIVSSYISDGMGSFFLVEEWKERLKWEDQIYRDVYRSLDRNIVIMGSKPFHAQTGKI